MVTNRLISTRTTNFRELVGNFRDYRVPSFQRNYAWTTENWEELWQDILISHEEKQPHFMGAIVTQDLDTTPPTVTPAGDVDERDKYEPLAINIIDGQQRFATLSIIAIAIIQKLQNLIAEGVDSELNRERADILKRTYLGGRDPRSLRYSSKLSLNKADNGFYQNSLVNFRAPTNTYALTESECLLWRSFEYFSRQLDSYSNLSKEGALLAELLTNTIAQRLVFIQISVDEETNAYVLFETLNSRGVELGATDLLKNYIFSLLRGPDDHNAARYEWQKIIDTVGMADFPDFLRCFLSMTEAQVKRNRLFKLTREKLETAEQAFDLLAQLSSYSDLYAALRNDRDDFWNVYNNSKHIKDLVRQLNLFGAQQTYPVLLAASTKFDEGKFGKLLRVMVVLAFRYIVVSGLSAKELETQCSLLAIAISNGKIKTPKVAFDQLSSILYVKDDKFEQDFSLLTSNQLSKALLKYILRKLEKEHSGKDVAEESFSIEHILPQKPDESWWQSFNHSKLNSFIYRLGNMTPLEPAVNSSLGRASYAKKQSTYAKSAFSITQAISAEAWTADAIIKRQEWMAKQAVKIWRIDY